MKNYLKENLFAIAVGGVSVLLGAVAFFLIYQPLKLLGDEEAALKADVKKLSAYKGEKKFVPTEDYKQNLEERKAAQEQDLAVGVSYYEEKQEKFSRFFDGASEQPSLDVFSSNYNQGLNDLIGEYRKKFGIKVEPGQEEQTRPTVHRYEIEPGQGEKQIPAAMKEYWIVEAVFKACMELNLKGLKSINFGIRQKESGEAFPYHRLTRAEVQIDLPFSDLEQLVTRLLASERVLFQLEDLVMKKDPASLEKFKTFEVRKEYPNVEASQKDTYESLIEEPDVMVILKLQAVDWTGIPPDPPEEAKPPAEKGERPGRR